MAPHANGTPTEHANASLPTPFSPITPSVRDGVLGMNEALEQAGLHIQTIESANEEGQISMETLRREIALLEEQLEELSASQNIGFNTIRISLGVDLKRDIKEARSNHIQTKIDEEVDHYVKSEVKKMIESRNLIHTLEKLSADNKALLVVSQLKLENSEARRLNSNFDERHNYHEHLHVVYNSKGLKYDDYPITLRALFGYDEYRVSRLLQHYDLIDCGNKTDNLKRFLAFIGVKRVKISEYPVTLSHRTAVGGINAAMNSKQANGSASRIEVRGQSKSNEHNKRKSPAENRTSRARQRHSLNQHRTYPPVIFGGPWAALIPVSMKQVSGDVEKASAIPGKTKSVTWFQAARMYTS